MWIPEIKKAWKLFSIRVATVGTAAALLWTTLPEAQRSSLEQALHLTREEAVILWGIAMLVARLKAQKGL